MDARDYLTAVLHEYEGLRSEIRFRTNIRYGVIAVLTAGILALIRMIFSDDTPATVSVSQGCVLLVLIPYLWFVAMALQIILIAQIERLGKAICLSEYKTELLFADTDGEDIKQFMATLDEDAAVRNLGEISLRRSSPMIWQRLLNSQKRFWDKNWYRIGIPLCLPVVLSMIGPIFIQDRVDKWSTCHTVGMLLLYSVVAYLIYRVACHPRAFGEDFSTTNMQN